MHQLYDWGEFEKFVSELYRTDGEILIERNKIEEDKYGARRETDVKITHRKGLHTYVTLVECKRWKEPVSRNRVDVLAASVEGFNAQKGVIFTTKGYEAGAQKYAKGKGIDLFVVRELSNEEWGLPGRHIQFYMHFWTGQFGSIAIPNAALTVLIDDFSGNVDLDIRLSADKMPDPLLNLHSIKNGRPGPNLLALLSHAHAGILNHLSAGVGVQNDGKDVAILFEVPGRMNFAATEFKQLRLREGALNLLDLSFTFVARLDQTEIRVDRADKVDLAVAVEDLFNEHRFLAVKAKGEPSVGARPMESSSSETPGDRPMENGSILRMIAKPEVSVPVDNQATVGLMPARALLKVMSGADGKVELQIGFEVATANFEASRLDNSI